MECGAASGTSSCSLSQTGYRFSGAYRRADSPMSMTSPMTTLTRGHCAPLLNRSSAAPPSTVPQHPSFFGAICGSGPITSLSRRSTRTPTGGHSARRRSPVSFALGPCPVNLESFVECTDVRWTEPSSECNRRIRMRHVATRSDFVAISVRVSSRLRFRVA